MRSRAYKEPSYIKAAESKNPYARLPNSQTAKELLSCCTPEPVHHATNKPRSPWARGELCSRATFKRIQIGCCESSFRVLSSLLLWVAIIFCVAVLLCCCVAGVMLSLRLSWCLCCCQSWLTWHIFLYLLLLMPMFEFFCIQGVKSLTKKWLLCPVLWH